MRRTATLGRAAHKGDFTAVPTTLGSSAPFHVFRRRPLDGGAARARAIDDAAARAGDGAGAGARDLRVRGL